MVADDQWGSLVARADLYQDRGDAKALLEVAHEVLGGWPDNPYGFRLLASAHALRGSHALAVDAMRKAVALNPESVQSLFELGYHLRGKGDPVAAEAAIRSSLQQDPDYVWNWVELARICLDTSDKDGADRYARHALTLEPENVVARQELASVHTARDEHEEALRILTEALSIEPENADVWDDRAQSLLKLKRPKEAEKAAREALRLEPDNRHYRSSLYRCIREQSWVRRGLLWPGKAIGAMWNAVEYEEPRDKDNTPRAFLFLATFLPIIALGALWVACCCTLLVLYELLTRPYVRRRAQGRGALSGILYAGGALVLAAGILFGLYWALGSWVDWKNIALTLAGAFALLMIWGEWDDARNAKRAQARQQWAAPLEGIGEPNQSADNGPAS